MRRIALLLATVLCGCGGRDKPAPPRERAPAFRLDDERPAAARSRGHVIVLVLPESVAALKSRADRVLAENGISSGLWTRDLGSSSLIVEAADGERARELLRALDDFRAYVPK